MPELGLPLQKGSYAGRLQQRRWIVGPGGRTMETRLPFRAIATVTSKSVFLDILLSPLEAFL
jgi:hypothetical protein